MGKTISSIIYVFTNTTIIINNGAYLFQSKNAVRWRNQRNPFPFTTVPGVVNIQRPMKLNYQSQHHSNKKRNNPNLHGTGACKSLGILGRGNRTAEAMNAPSENLIGGRIQKVGFDLVKEEKYNSKSQKVSFAVNAM